MSDSHEPAGPRPDGPGAGVEPGSVFAGLRIAERIGAGGMGEVFRARDESLGRDVALKLLPPALTSDEGRRARFEAETRAMATVAHPNIVALYAAGTFEGTPYVVTELLVGHTLQSEIRRTGPMPPARLTSIAIQIARALAAVHDRGVIHCDLKPSNIFLLEDDHVKILDFGLARLLAPSWQPRGDEDDTPSFPNEIFGSPGFMSPEQVEGRTVDHRADIFAFGAVLYEMLWGEPAFKGPTSVETMYSVLRERAPRLADVSRSSAPIERIIERCLEKRPESRFQSAKDLLFALKHLSHVEQTAPRPRIARSRPSKRAAWVTAAGAATLVVAITAATLLRGSFAGSEEPPPPAIELLTTHGKAMWAAISPDGRYFAHTFSTPSGYELRLRDIDAGSELLLDGPTRDILGEVIFAPDQSAIYYGKRPAPRGSGTAPALLAFYRIPFIGGTPQKLAEGMWLGTTALSPDGRHLSYTCGIDCRGREVRMVSTSGDGEPQVLFEYEGFAGTCIWSDDGATLWCPGLRFELATRTLTVLPRIGERGSTAPYRGKGGSLVAGRMVPADRFNQLWWIPESGVPVRAREDLLDYINVSVSDDGDVVAVAEKRTTNLYLHSSSTGRATRLTTGIESLDGAEGVSLCADGTIVYGSEAVGNAPSIWRIDPISRERTRLTEWAAGDSLPECSPDSRTVVFTRFAPGTQIASLWRMNRDGSDPKQLFGDGAHVAWPAISPDGTRVLFTRFGDPAPAVWSVNLDGSDARLLIENARTNDWSPDGRSIVVWDGNAGPEIRVIDAATLEVLTTLPLAGTPQFSADGNAIVKTERHPDFPVLNLWAYPLDGGEPTRLTDLPLDVVRFDVSPSGDIAIACGETSRDVVLLRGLLDELITGER